jgi:DNA-binding SARP family transcriptional activator/tetratricopeptide (TPR) repeat protein
VFFRLLGPVELWVRDHAVDIGPQRHRALLAALLFSPRRVVPTSTLIDRVWGESAPASVRNTLYSYITRLRRVLERCSPPGSPPILLGRGGGYLLDIEPELVDLHRFRSLMNRARRCGRDDEAFIWLSDEALHLWRDDPLANVSGDWFAGQREALSIERLGAIAESFDAHERLGRDAELISQLASTLEAHPLSEPIAFRLIAALRRAGRKAEAVACFARVRARIADELGVEPGDELQELHLRLLHEDSGAELTVRPKTFTNLPAATADFTGRVEELDWLVDRVTRATPGTPTIVAVNGLAGVGKTTLVLHAAQRLGVRYPDAHLYVDLCGHTPERERLSPEEALDTLLRCIGVPAADVPGRLDERVALWRTQLHRKRTLVVLDNAATVEQLQLLLPSSGDTLVLVTSRKRLLGLAGAHPLNLDPFPRTDAALLFERMVGLDRIEGEAEAVAEVLALCGYLPLAVRIAAARLQHRPTWTVEHLLTRLREQSTPLAELADGNRGVAASIHLSYAQLTPDHRRMFRLAGLVPGQDFDVYAGAALVERTVGEARRLLEDLVDANLLQQHRPDRYRAHDLVRGYARHMADIEDGSDGRRRAIGRLLDYYRRAAFLANGRITTRPAPFDLPANDTVAAVPELSDRSAAMAWLKRERTNLVAAVQLAANANWPAHAWQIASRLWYFLDLQGYFDDWIGSQRLAVAAAMSSGDRDGEGIARYSLGIAYRRSGRYSEAVDELRRTYDLGREAGSDRRQADALNSLGCVHLLRAEYTKAIETLGQARDLYHRIGDGGGETGVTLNLGIVALHMADYERAGELCQTAIERSLLTGADHNRTDALLTLADVRSHTGEPQAALRLYREAADLAREIDNPGFEARAVNGIARVTAAAGDLAQALDGHQQALTQFRRLGDRSGQAEVHLAFGDSYRAHAATSSAVHHYRQALTLARQIDDRLYEAQAVARLAALATS